MTLLRVLLGFSAVLAAAGCGGPAKTDALERIQREGVVRVGYANEAPYAYMDSAKGELTGEAPEILRAVMERLGVDEVEGVLTEFGALIPGLKAGRFDIIAAGMYITPARCEQISFSNPTYAVGEAFVVRKDNPNSLHSYEDLREDESATLGVMAGAVEQGYARAVGIPDNRIVVFPDNVSGVEGVLAGRVDAYAATSLTVSDLLSKLDSDSLERADPFTDPVIDGVSVRGYGAFGFRQSDAALREAVNRELADFIGSDEHLTLVAPFGFGDEHLPGAITADELCGG